MPIKNKTKPEMTDLVQAIGKLARAGQQLARQAEQQYTFEVEALLKAQSRDPQRIEHLLDGMLDFCFDPAMLYLCKKGPVRIELVKTGLSEIRFKQRFLIPAAQVGKRKEVLREWYIRQARNKILPRVNHHARELGVTFAGVKIVDNRYRWGSCTMNNNVNFNWRLIKAPMLVVDYVIIHELAHLIEANHTPRFWNIVRAQAPTVEKARAWLKENGQLLEEAV